MAGRPDGQPFPSRARVDRAVVFKDGGHVAPPRSSCASWSARAGWPTISTSPASACCRRCRSSSTQPFWLDPSDPHRMAAAIQVLTRPRARRLQSCLGRLAARPGWQERDLGARPSTASSPRASAPSRRSTRRSLGSSRSWPSSRGHRLRCACSRFVQGSATSQGRREWTQSLLRATIMRRQVIASAATLAIAPIVARAADLVV